jgi:F-type H+-transporting ATPase subunit b
MIMLHLFTQTKAAIFLLAFYWAEVINPLIPRTVNLLIFLAVMFFILRKPLTQAFQNRRGEIIEELKRAKAEKEEAEKRLREIDARLARLDEEVAEIRANAEREAKAEFERLIKQAQDEAERIKAMAEREIEGASKAAHLQLKEFVAAKSVELAENMIRKEIKPEDDDRLITNFARELEEVK